MSKPSRAPKVPKTPKQRTEEVQRILGQIQELGLHGQEGVAEFLKVLDGFNTDGIGASGRIPLRGLKRVLEYKLSTQPHVPSVVVLKAASHV